MAAKCIIKIEKGWVVAEQRENDERVWDLRSKSAPVSRPKVTLCQKGSRLKVAYEVRSSLSILWNYFDKNQRVIDYPSDHFKKLIY